MSVGYPNEYAQVVINILNNAKDAIIENNINNLVVIAIILYFPPINMEIE